MTKNFDFFNVHNFKKDSFFVSSNYLVKTLHKH